MTESSARTAQVAALSAQFGEAVPRVVQTCALVAYKKGTKPRVTQLAMLVARRPPAAKQTRATQVIALAATEGAPLPRVTQVAALVVYRTGVPGELRTRAWTFDLDGHSFYVLSLGEEGTFVYDKSTGEWSEFETSGYGTWNMAHGLTWNGRVIAADLINPFAWELDPDSVLDEGWRPVEHVVTGGLPSRSRTGVTQTSLRLAASVGVVGEDGAVMRLRISDDNGKTWFDADDVPVPEGDFEGEIAWRSLGTIQAPGRIFEVSDSGGVITIYGADADLDGVDSDG